MAMQVIKSPIMTDVAVSTVWEVLCLLPVDAVTKVLTNLELCDLRNFDSAACTNHGRQELLESMSRLPAVDGRTLNQYQNDAFESILKWIFHKQIQVTGVSIGDEQDVPPVLFGNATSVHNIELFVDSVLATRIEGSQLAERWNHLRSLTQWGLITRFRPQASRICGS